MPRSLCRHASDVIDYGRGQNRRCGLNLHETVTRKGECSTCEQWAARDPGGAGARTAGPRKSLAVLAPCPDLGDRLPNQPCGGALYRCGHFGDVTVRFGACLDAQRSCGTCDEHPERKAKAP